jgi:hypothetical protein
VTGMKDAAEIEFIADRLVAKVWQGDESRRGVARQAAAVAMAALQDYTEMLYTERDLAAGVASPGVDSPGSLA